MNETTLNALINLFALFSSISESRKEDALHTFTVFMQLHLGVVSSEEYMQLFEELLSFYGVGEESPILIDKEEQAGRICQNIKGMIRKEEQIMVFLRFLELAKSGNTEKAKGLFQTVSEVFEIPRSEYEKFLDFIFDSPIEETTSPDFIVINGKETDKNISTKHIYRQKLDGEILFLYSSLIHSFIFIYKGKASLTLGENPIRPNCFYAFKEGSIIRGARIAPLYYIDIASCFTDVELASPFVFTGEEIDFRFKNSNNGLHTFSFSERSGQLIAIMGGSGVGKSTLINILNGNISPQKGTVCINSYDIHKNKKEIEGLIGYVPQDDLLFEELTVWENLYYNTCLCFNELSKEEINKKVDSLLLELELYPFKDLKVGSPLKKIISGGQRKRLNVAMELIREPAVLFVDEPTSGLSSTDSEMVMLLLKEQARKGKLILVNIHQPSSTIYKLFDKLWVLDKGGRIIFTGNPLDAIIYFKKATDHINAEVSECIYCGNVNPEQVLEIIETKKIDSSGNFTSERRFSPDYWFKQFRNASTPKRSETQEIPNGLPCVETKRPNILKQFRIFFKRNLRTKLADTQYILVNLLEAPILALIVAYFTRYSDSGSYVFFENKSFISYIFMSIVVVIFMGMSVSAEEIIKDRKILQREAFLNLNRLSYLNSKVLFLLLLSAVQSFCFVWIGNSIIELEYFIWPYWMILFSVAFCSNLIGLNISSALDSVVTIYILIPLMLIPQILLCGVIVKFDDLQSTQIDKDAVPLIGDMMVSRWAFEALAVEQYTNNPYMVHFYEIEKEIANNRYRSDLLIPELIGQLDMLAIWSERDKNEKALVHKLSIVENETKALAKEEGASLPSIFQFNSESFDPNIIPQVKEYLNLLKKDYQESSQRKQKEKDHLINKLNQLYGSDYLYNLKMKYHNSSLESILLHSDSKRMFRITPNGIMQKIAPVYKKSDYKNGRAHFFASKKNLFENEFNTYTFNLAIIWLMCVFLYISLYYDWLRKVITLFTYNKIITGIL